MTYPLHSLSTCLDTKVPFRPPIQIARFLPFQKGKNALFTVETVVERNGTVASKQALKLISAPLIQSNLETSTQ